MENQQNKFVKDQKQCNLTEEQIAIIYSDIKKDIKISACAGSGKTTILVLRIKYLIEKGIDPEQILVTVFNIQAGNDLKERASNLLGKDIADKLEINNIDKIANKWIKQIQQESENQFELSYIEIQNQFLEILENPLKNQGILDKYKYIFFDEFQDINELQYKILLSFKRQGAIINVIGDDAQNIYQFRGSDNKYLRKLIVEDVNSINLNNNMLEFQMTKNFRCSKEITLFTNNIISNSEELEQKKIDYLLREEDQQDFFAIKNRYGLFNLNQRKPQVFQFPGYQQQFDQVISQIKQLKNQFQYRLNQFAIISPFSAPLKKFEELIEIHNIQTIIPEDKIQYISHIGENKNYTSKYKPCKNQNRLTLSTIHKSKGLEWKVVFIIGLNDDQLPMKFLKEQGLFEQKIEECRRLFYVGCTRATNDLFLLAFGSNYQNRKVTRFLSKIDKELYDSKTNLKIEEETKVKQQNIESGTDFKMFDLDLIVSKMQYEQLKYSEKYLKKEDIQVLECEKIHEKTKYSKEKFNQIFYFQQEEILFSFIQAYIQRSVAEIYKINDGYTYFPASPTDTFDIDNFEKISNSYEIFKNINYKTQDIMKDIYEISKIPFLKKFNTKYKYQNSFEIIRNEKLIQNIQEFIAHLINKKFENISFLEPIKEGELIIQADETLYQIIESFDIQNKIQKEQILKTLLQISMFKRYQNLNIKKICFYNPITGLLYSCDITNQKYHDNYINFIISIHLDEFDFFLDEELQEEQQSQQQEEDFDEEYSTSLDHNQEVIETEILVEEYSEDEQLGDIPSKTKKIKKVKLKQLLINY